MSDHDIFTKGFWKGTIVRAVKTFCQTLAAILTAQAVDIISADWIGLASIAGMAAFVSVLTSVYGGYAVNDTQNDIKIEQKPYNPKHLAESVSASESEEKGQ